MKNMPKPTERQIVDQLVHYEADLGGRYTSYNLILLSISKMVFREGIKHPPNRLVNAIKKREQFPPVVVRKKEEMYLIMDGHNRASGAKEVGVEELWALIIS